MTAQEPRPADAPEAIDEDDTEGQAFKWSVVDDPKTGRRLRQSWTPDDPQDPRTARSHSTTDRKPSESR